MKTATCAGCGVTEPLNLEYSAYRPVDWEVTWLLGGKSSSVCQRCAKSLKAVGKTAMAHPTWCDHELCDFNIQEGQALHERVWAVEAEREHDFIRLTSGVASDGTVIWCNAEISHVPMLGQPGIDQAVEAMNALRDLIAEHDITILVEDLSKAVA